MFVKKFFEKSEKNACIFVKGVLLYPSAEASK